jgi:2,3-bisphosphoglycerate-dependent phosphoglycerate mutase
MARLILTRHGESQFNAKSLWTGNWDVPLTDKGRHDAAIMAEAIRDIEPAVAFTSNLSRATETLAIILRTNGWRPTVHADAKLAERDYGDLTGMNKWAVEKDHGVEQFNKWRRGWDEPVPGGETLKDVYARVIPYYREHILPELVHGRDVIITAHGNSLRTLIKYLDHLSDTAVQNLEMPFGEVMVYTIGTQGEVTAKITRQINPATPPA